MKQLTEMVASIYLSAHLLIVIWNIWKGIYLIKPENRMWRTDSWLNAFLDEDCSLFLAICFIGDIVGILAIVFYNLLFK